MSRRYRVFGKTVSPCSLTRFIGVHVVLWAYFVFTLSPAALGQQVVVAGTTNTQTGSAGNGVPIVNISGANSQGVSVNQYNQFNVEKQGLILNNSTATTTTQLGGYILGNANLVQNGPAKVILNEVVSSSPSALNGYMEVAGRSAAVVVANPNGISCDGCGFINTSRATLTTGKAIYGGSGSLDGFRVTGGTISFNGAGLNASNVSQVDVLSRAVQLNAAIYGNNLNVITGINQINYAGLGVQMLTDQGTGTTPRLSLDVGALGGMYAGKISIIGTEAGMGVNSLGKFQAQSGDFTLNSQGDVVLGNTTTAAGNASISGANVTNNGLVYAAGNASISGTGTMNNTGTAVAGGNLAVQGTNVQSTGVLAAGINADGSLGTSGDLSATAQNQLTLNGVQAAGGNLSLTGGGIDLSNGVTVANGAVALTSAGNIDAHNSELYAGALSVTAPGTLTTTGSALIAGQLTASVDNWNNAGGVVAQTGSGTANIAVNGALTNASGTLQSSDGLAVQAGSVDNTNGQISANSLQIQSAGTVANQNGLILSSGAMQVTAGGALTNQNGQIGSTSGAVTVQAGSMDNTNGLVVAMGTQAATLNVANTLNNGGKGVIESNGALAVNAGTLSTDAPSTIAGGDVSIHTTGAITNAGTIQSNGGLSLNTAGLTNTGLIQSAADTTLTSSGAIVNSNSVQSGGALTINASNQAITNSGTISSNGTLTVTAATLENTGGAIVNSDANGSATNVAVSQGLTNQGGVLGGIGDVSVNAGSIDNSQGQLVSQSGALAITADGALANTGGLVQSTNALNVRAGGIDNTAGTISSVGTGTVMVATSGMLTNAVGTDAAGVNHGGVIGGNGNVSVSAGTLSNSADGQIISGGDLAVSTSGQTTNRGAIQAGGALNLTANGLNNSGAIAGTTSTTLASSGAVTNTYLIQSGGALSIAAQNQSITNSGAISSNGVMNIQAGSLDNSTGHLVNTDTAASSTTLALSGQLTNQGGVIGGQGDVVISADNINNNGQGQLISTNGALNVTAGSVDNVDGQIVGLGGGPLALTVVGALTNGGQGVIGSNGNVTISAGTLNTDTASQIVGSNVLVNTSGTATNAGSIQSTGAGTNNGTLTLNTAGLTNSGTLASGGALQLNDTASLTNTGTVQSGDAVSIQANNLTNNNVIVSNGTLTVAAASLNNNGGTLVNRDSNGSATTVTVTNALTNEGGTIGGIGATAISAGSVDNNNGGRLLSVNDGLTLTSSGAITNTNRGLIQGNSALSVTGASLDNTGGSVEVVEAQPLNLSVTGLLNNGTGGLIGSNGTLNLSFGTFNNAGALFTGQDLSFTSYNLFTNTGILESGGTITVDGIGIDNSGTLSGNRGVSLTSTGAVSNTGYILSGAAFTLNADNQSVTNSGVLGAQGETSITAGSLNNTGGTIANTDTNASGTTVAVAGALINKGGVIGGQGDVGVTAGSIDNSNIDSSNIGQLLSIGGTTTVRTTGALDNIGGLIQSNHGMTVSAASVDNTGGQIKDTGNGNVAITTGDTLTNGGNGLIGGNQAVTINAGTLNTDSASNILSGSTLNITTGAATNAGIINSGDALNLTTVGLTNTGTIQSNAGLTLRDTGTATSNSGTIQSNGVTNINVANLNNSRMLVNGDANQSATTINLHGGTLTNNGGTIGGLGDVAILDAATINNATTGSSQSRIISSNGNLALSASGAITNTDALMQGQTGLTVNAASMNNQGGQVVANGVDAVLNITATNNGTYDNSMGGTTGSNGTTILNVGTLKNNTGGMLSGANSLNVSSGVIDNTGTSSNGGGVMISGGDVTISGTSIDNTNGQIGISGNANHSAALSITGTSLNNINGTIANSSEYGSTSISLSGALTNSGTGRIQSNNGLTIGAGSASNSGTIAQLGGSAGLALTATTVTNSGTIGSNGSLIASVGSLTNTGSGVLSAVSDLNLALNLTPNGTLTNDGGKISSGGTLEVTAANQAINNQSNGIIQSIGAATITAASLNNSGGSIFAGNNDNASRLTLNVANINNHAGSVGSFGDSIINDATTIDNSANGQLQSGGNLTINLGSSLNNNAGTVSANNQLIIHGANATLDNTNGSLSGNGGVTATLAGLTNTNGTITSAQADTALTLGSWSGDGTYNVGGNLTVSLQGDFTDRGSATYNVNGMTTLDAGGTFTNATNLGAANGMTINAANVVNQSGAVIASGSADGIGSAITQVNALGTLTNAGSINGPAVQLTASTLNNTGTVLGQNVAVNAATINSGSDPGADNLTDGYAQGTITATNQLNVITQHLTNIDATIQSYGTLTIAGNATGGNATLVENKSGLIQTVNEDGAFYNALNTLTINADTITNARRVLANSTTTDPDYDQQLDEYNREAQAYERCMVDRSGGCYPPGPPPVPSSVDIVIASKQSQIVSSGNMALNVGTTVNNDASLLAALGNLNISGVAINDEASLPAVLGNLAANGVVVNNISHNESNVAGSDTSLNAVIEANGTVSISAGSINNITAPISSLPTSATVHVANATASGVTGTTNNTGASVSGQSLGDYTANAPGAQVNSRTLRHGDPTATTITSAELPANQSVPNAGSLNGVALNNQMRQVDPVGDVTNQADQIDQNTSQVGDVSDTLANPTAVNNVRRPVHISLSGQNGAAPGQAYPIAGGAYDNFSNFITSGPFLSQLGVDGTTNYLQGGIVTGAQSSINQRTTDLNAIPLYENNSNSQNLYASFLQNGVPVSPVTVGDNSHNPAGSLISGSNVVLMASGDIVNGGTLQSGGELDLVANNFTNNSGTLKSSGNLLVNTTGNIADNSGLFSSGGNMLLLAGGDLGLTASTLNATGSLGLLAGGNIDFNTTQSTKSIANGWTTTNNLTNLTSGGDMAIYAGNNLTSNAAQLTSGGALSLGAGNNLTLQSVINDAQTSTTTYGKHSTDVLNTNTQTVVGTALNAIGDINLNAGNTLTMAASSATSVNGAVNLSANTVNLSTVNQESTSNENYVYKKSGFLSSTTITSTTTSDLNQAIGSVLSGNTVNITSVGDTTLTGASVVGTGGVSLQAGGNINIAAATNTLSSKTTTVSKKSGLLSGGFMGISIGSQKQTTTTTDNATALTGSVVGSLSGNVDVGATNTYTQTASALQANNGDINIKAGAVNIQAGTQTDNSTYDSVFKQTGLTISLGGAVVSALAGIAETGLAAANGAEAGGSAGQAATTGFLSAADNGANVWQMLKKPTGLTGGIPKGNILGTGKGTGVRLSVSLGYSESESHSTTDTTTTIGSSVSGNNVSITATGSGTGNGDVNVTGSSINGTGNVALDAARNLSLTAAQDTSNMTSNNSSISASIGASFNVGGTSLGLGFSGSFSKGDGNASSTGTTNANTVVNADNNLTLTSGNNTTLAGAVASGNQVTTNVGGNLEIQSLQDTSTYNSTQQGFGVGGSFGAGAPSISASISNSAVNEAYQSVQQQSGIEAGDGGFNVNVNGNTNLVGGIIESSAAATTAGLNTLNTGSLTASSILNLSNYSANGMDISGSVVFTGKSDGISKNPKVLTPIVDPKNGKGVNSLSAKPNTYAFGIGVANSSGDQGSLTDSGISGANVTIGGVLQTDGIDYVDSSVATGINSSNALAQNPNGAELGQQVQARAQIGNMLTSETTKLVMPAIQSALAPKTILHETCSDINDASTCGVVEVKATDVTGKVRVFDQGMNETPQAAATVAYAAMKQHVGEGEMYLVINPYAGGGDFLSDLIYTGYDKFNRMLEGVLPITNAERANVDIIKSASHVDLMGYSRGGLTIANALQYMKDNGIKGNIKINLFGSAANAIATNDLLKSVIINKESYSPVTSFCVTGDTVCGLIGLNPSTGSVSLTTEINGAKINLPSSHGYYWFNSIISSSTSLTQAPPQLSVPVLKPCAGGGMCFTPGP